jgi:hypothetical protein
MATVPFVSALQAFQAAAVVVQAPIHVERPVGAALLVCGR